MKRRWWFIVGACVLGFLVVVVTLVGRGAPTLSARVERADLVIGVEVEGTLRAVEASPIGPPNVPDLWRFKISMMADEGTDVTAGEPVLGFDRSELEQRLRTKLADLDAARTEVEKKRVDIAITVANDGLLLAEMESKLRKARLISSQPAMIRPDIEVEKARLDLELAELEVVLISARVDATTRAGKEELRVLEADLTRVEADVAQLRDSIEKMTRTAPRDGIIIHTTDWRNEKKKVGDVCWDDDIVIEIPDLDRMEGEGEVEEAEAGRIRNGLPVVLRLDAHPDREYGGRVESFSRAVRQKSFWNPLKVVRLTLSLDKTDAERMRPGMRFSGTIEVDRLNDATVLPLAAVFRGDNGPVAYRRGWVGWHEVGLILGDRNAEQIAVIEGLDPGDSVSLVAAP